MIYNNTPLWFEHWWLPKSKSLQITFHCFVSSDGVTIKEIIFYGTLIVDHVIDVARYKLEKWKDLAMMANSGLSYHMPTNLNLEKIEMQEREVKGRNDPMMHLTVEKMLDIFHAAHPDLPRKIGDMSTYYTIHKDEWTECLEMAKAWVKEAVSIVKLLSPEKNLTDEVVSQGLLQDLQFNARL